MPIVLIGIGIILVFFISANWGSGSANNCLCPAPQTCWPPCPPCPGGTINFCGKLTAQQIAVFASNAGFASNDLAIAVAIALAESGGDPGAYNPVKASDNGRPLETPDGQGAIGLWQIYLYVHPEFVTFNLYDPQQNAQAAFNLYQRRGFRFSDWTTFTTGKYQKYLPVAQQAASMIFNQGGALANV